MDPTEPVAIEYVNHCATKPIAANAAGPTLRHTKISRRQHHNDAIVATATIATPHTYFSSRLLMIKYLRPRHVSLPLVRVSKQHRQDGFYEPGQIVHVRHLPL